MPEQGAKNNAGSPWNPDERQVAFIGPTTLHKPLGLLAELTHRCPLGCPYCSNPRTLDRRETELDTATWVRIMQQAAALGILQVHLSGGEPAARRDLAEITAAARTAGLLGRARLHAGRRDSAAGIYGRIVIDSVVPDYYARYPKPFPRRR
jgi:hypothetical protein